MTVRRTAVGTRCPETRFLLFTHKPGQRKSLWTQAREELARLPPMTPAEIAEVTSNFEAANLGQHVSARPLRAPHCTVSSAGLVGSNGRPGEVALAHRGALVLDELPFFMPGNLKRIVDVVKKGKDKGGFLACPALVIGMMSDCPCSEFDEECLHTAVDKREWRTKVTSFLTAVRKSAQ